ncbi:hypothetical protein ACRAWD_03560 [Caulobacter segnis]
MTRSAGRPWPPRHRLRPGRPAAHSDRGPLRGLSGRHGRAGLLAVRDGVEWPRACSPICSGPGGGGTSDWPAWRGATAIFAMQRRHGGQRPWAVAHGRQIAVPARPGPSAWLRRRTAAATMVWPELTTIHQPDRRHGPRPPRP